MEDRTQKLLNSIILEHIKTAEPVGSQMLVDKYKLDISPATARNEMAALEEAGYIRQPHTSAGRVPTAKAYQFFVDNFLTARELKDSEQKTLKDAAKKLPDDKTQAVKELAKGLAELSGALVFVGFEPNNSYYTGLSNLFSQPEFSESGLVYDLSQVVDHLDEVMAKVFQLDLAEPRILIGTRNPFGQICSSVVASYPGGLPAQAGGKGSGVFGLIGPMRMDYAANVGLITYAKNLINNF